MSVQIVRFSVDESDVAEVEAALQTMCAAINRAAPAGARFAACRIVGSNSFLNVLELDDGVANPLPGIEECRAFQERLPGWALAAEPPAPLSLSVLGSHELF